MRDECTKHGALLIFDEVMTGFRVARGGAQQIFGVKPDLTVARQSDWRRFAGRSVWRTRRNHGSAFARRPGLSGRNAVGKSARDGRRSRATPGIGTNRRLEITGRLGRAVRATGARRGCENEDRPHVSSHRFDVLFVLCLRTNCRSHRREAKRSEAIRKIFPACLERGVYFAPSQFETGFISTAHTVEDISRTAEIVGEALRSV